MVTLFGCVLDAENPAGCPDPAELLAAGFMVVRLTAKDSQQLYAYAERLRAAGIKIVLVWTLATVGKRPRAEVVERIARRCPADYHIIGNEPDAIYNLDDDGNPYPSDASDAMDEHTFGPWFGAVVTPLRHVQPSAIVILAGMVSGQPWAARRYVDVVRRSGHRLDGIDLHLYNTRPDELGPKLELFAAEFPTLPLYMSEWSRPAAEIGDFMRVLEAFDVAFALYFAWMPTDLEGLRDADGQPTAEYFTYAGELARRPFVTSGPVDTESNGEGDEMSKYTVAEGIANAMAERGDEPASDETYRPDGQTSEAFGQSGCWYVYLPATNTVQVFEPTNPKA